MGKTEPPEQREEVGKGAKPCSIDNVERPFVLLSRERLDTLKQDIRAPGRRRDLFERFVKSNADRWVVRDFELPAPAGHYHNYTCTDGTRLVVPENQEIGTKGPYRCPVCGKTYEGEKYDGALRNYEHTWIIVGCRDLALTWALTGEEQYGMKAAHLLRQYADAYPGRHTAVTKGGLFYQSLDESMKIIILAQAYDLMRDSKFLSNEDIHHIEYDLFWECAEGLTKMGTGGNWGSWHLSAVGVIGLATRHQRYIDFGVTHFKQQITDQLGSDGLWPESVHTYHFFPLRAFLLFAEAATNAGIDLYAWEAGPNKSLKAMLLQPLGYMYPDLRMPAINDGWFESFLPQEQYAVAAYRFDDPAFAWALQECRMKAEGRSAGSATTDPSWLFVLDRELPAEIPAPSFGSVNFDNLGVAVLRSGSAADAGGETVLTFDYGRMLGHGQPDKMGVTLFARGRLLAADYGTPSYGSAILPYYKGTVSHNTVIVDSENQKGTKRNGLLAFNSNGAITVCAAETGEAYPGVAWRRTVLLTDKYGLVVDDVKSDQEHVYDWFFHSEGDRFTLGGVGPNDTPSTFTQPYVSDAQPHRSKGSTVEGVWEFEDGPVLKVTCACDAGDEVFAARCPAETGTRTVPLFVLRKTGRDFRFVSLLETECEGARADKVKTPLPNRLRVEDDDAIAVRAGEGNDRIEISRDGVKIRAGGAEPPTEISVQFNR